MSRLRRDSPARRAAQSIAEPAADDPYRALLDASPDAVLIVAADGRIEAANRHASALLAAPPGSLANRQLDRWLVPPEEDGVGLRSAIGGHAAWHGHAVVARDDGARLAVTAWVTPLRNADGAVAAVVVRPEKPPATPADDAEPPLSLLFAANPLPMWIYDLETLAFLEVNAAAVALYGYSRDEFLAMRISDIRPPEDVARLEAHLAGIGEGLDAAGEWRHRTKDGRVIDVEITGHPLPYRGRAASLVVARDITAQREAQQRLQAAEATYRTLVEQIPAAVYTRPAAAGATITYLSPRIADILGYSPAEALARPGLFEDDIHPDDLAAVDALDARTDRTGEPFDARYRVRHADGHWVWVRDQARPVVDARSQPVAWLGLLTDVSEEMNRAEALRASEARFRALALHAADAITLLDAEGRIVALSPMVEASMRRTAADLLGRSGFEIVHPDDRPVLAGALAALLADPTVRPRVEFRVRYGDNGWHWQEAVGTNLLADPAVGAIVVVSRDIGDRKAAQAALLEAETRYRTLVEQLPAVVYVLANDPTQTPLYYSPFGETLFGFGLADRVADLAAGRTWHHFVHPDDLARVEAENARSDVAGDAFRAEYRHRRADGSYLWVRDEAVPIRDERGQIVAWHGLLFDISEAKRAETALREVAAAAEAANRLKSAFLSTMSHELRTPLNAVLGYAHLLLDGLDGPLSPPQQEDVTRIAEGAAHLLALIDDVLDLSRIEAGGLELTLEAVPLAEMVAQVVAQLAPQAAAKGLVVEVDVPTDLLVAADRQRLRQILLNLVGNAVKFTERGGVAVAACRTEAGIACTVRDTGIGIAAEALPVVFEEFRQADSSTSRRYGGSGLGLAITKRLVELHGGTIGVASEPGIGSTFRVVLPASGPSGGALARAQPRAPGR